MEFNKKRKRLDENIKKNEDKPNDEDNNSLDSDFEIDEHGNKRLNQPKKSNYRMRAHCNPLAAVSIALYIIFNLTVQ